ncbi:di/tricarboxylate transporter [Kibdelosporangium banguiense]|uniref:Di/tricarboxylate transporter n=1 Tax=Kibdelosporangium banguiense TaxID=1365924 RepID=A0ABS4T7Q0_9PSEU|nr:hypothetical protein [Kibdelosporangium banguiense]MBP2319959.1 di/tricarboxylate transporter [Kibdelosporangium banguiense]
MWLAVTPPKDLGDAVQSVPWNLLLFMAATTAMATALVTTGAANWLAITAFAPIRATAPWVFLRWLSSVRWRTW